MAEIKMMKFGDIEVKVHPAAEMFPMMEGPELNELAADIAKNGVQQPLVWTDEDELLDGRNPIAAIYRIPGNKRREQLMADLDAGRLSVSFDGKDPYAYVVSANLHRRHLTAEQKRDVIAALLKAQPEKSDRQIAEQAKSNRTTVGQVRKQLEKTGDVSTIDTRTDTKGRKQPATKKQTSKPKPPSDAGDGPVPDIDALRTRLAAYLTNAPYSAKTDLAAFMSWSSARLGQFMSGRLRWSADKPKFNEKQLRKVAAYLDLHEHEGEQDAGPATWAEPPPAEPEPAPTPAEPPRILTPRQLCPPIPLTKPDKLAAAKAAVEALEVDDFAAFKTWFLEYIGASSAADHPAPPTKRGRGRPKGSRNKPKAAPAC